MAISANIHFGLAAWASGSYSLGARVSAGGRSYQCITAGTSTAAPTGTGASINNGGTAVWKFLSAIDFTTLQAWANALPATLTQSYTALLWNDAPYTTTVGVALLSLSGHATTSANNITIMPAPGEAFYDTLNVSGGALAFNAANGVSLVLPTTGAGGINYIDVSDNWVNFVGLQVQDPNSASGSSIFATRQNVTFYRCIVDGFSQPSGASMFAGPLSGASSCVWSLLNCLIIDRGTDPSTLYVTARISYNMAIVATTIVATSPNANHIGFLNKGTAGSTTTVLDTIVFGYTDPFTFGSDTGALTNVSYTLTDDTTISGTGVTLGSGNQFSQVATDQFVSSTTNFRLKSTAAAVNSGVASTTYIPANIDILGTTRPQSASQDIGCYEFKAALSVFTGAVSVSGTAVARPIATSVFTGAVQVTGAAASSIVEATFNGAVVVSGSAIPTVSASSTFTGNVVVSGLAVNLLGSFSSSIFIDPIPAQPVETSFEVDGYITVMPSLQFADDGAAFAPIPFGGVSPLGTSRFAFQHPGLETGVYSLTVLDTTTGASTAANYVVTTSGSGNLFPPHGPTTTQKIVPSYLYQEYFDDENLQAFVSAQNAIAQGYLDWANEISLPVYTGLSGPLLDWVAEGLYGIKRPTIALVQAFGEGPYNTWALNTIAMNDANPVTSSTLYTVTDEIFRRILTWQLYTGDGRQFSVAWLKRRVMRFIGDADIDQTYQVSVSFTGSNQITIGVAAGSAPTTYAPVMRAAILSGVLPLPFQYQYQVLLPS